MKRNGLYRDTLVGYFDIMGYSSLIDNTPMEEIIGKMSKFSNEITTSADTDFFAVKLDHWILSDSIIITVDTNRHPLFSGSLECLLLACSMVLSEAVSEYNIPLRGAVGGGYFYKDGEIIVSSALVDAARYEKEQDWLGAVLTPNALELIEKAKKLQNPYPIDFSSVRFNSYVRYGKIPWKPAEKQPDLPRPEETYYIKPFKMPYYKAQGDNWPTWAKENLPGFNSPEKIENSHCLYAQG